MVVGVLMQNERRAIAVEQRLEDGFSLTRRVRNSPDIDGHLPAIAVSGFADARSKEAARVARFSAFLAKPARPEPWWA